MPFNKNKPIFGNCWEVRASQVHDIPSLGGALDIDALSHSVSDTALLLSSTTANNSGLFAPINFCINQWRGKTMLFSTILLSSFESSIMNLWFWGTAENTRCAIHAVWRQKSLHILKGTSWNKREMPADFTSLQKTPVFFTKSACIAHRVFSAY